MTDRLTQAELEEATESFSGVKAERDTLRADYQEAKVSHAKNFAETTQRMEFLTAECNKLRAERDRALRLLREATGGEDMLRAVEAITKERDAAIQRADDLDTECTARDDALAEIARAAGVCGPTEIPDVKTVAGKVIAAWGTRATLTHGPFCGRCHHTVHVHVPACSIPGCACEAYKAEPERDGGSTDVLRVGADPSGPGALTALVAVGVKPKDGNEGTGGEP